MSRELRALQTTTTGRIDRRAALRRVLRIFWGEAEPALRRRIAGTVGLLALTALLNALVPLLFARAIDALAPAAAALLAPAALVLAYVVVQWLAKVLSELRWALYGPIEQRTRRRLARHALEHLHALSLSFHLSRRTGQISRVLDQGLNGARELLFDGVFLILPLLAEVLFVAAIMLARLDLIFAVILIVTLALYAVALVVGSEWLRAHQRKAVTEGALAHGKAVDSLLNYETVKYFGNEDHISQRYDDSLARVEALTVRSLAFRSLTGIVFASILAVGTGLILHVGPGAGHGRHHDPGRAGPGQRLSGSAHPADGAAGPALPLDQAGLRRPGAADGAPGAGAGGGGSRRMPRPCPPAPVRWRSRRSPSPTTRPGRS